MRRKISQERVCYKTVERGIDKLLKNDGILEIYLT